MAYSRLCCQPSFYQRFLQFEFMLIYQLDCYVFEDRLALWCARNFDYIGPPWPNYEHMTESNKFIARLPFLKYFLRRAGQGGFSLRKTNTLYNAARILSKFSFLVNHYPEDVLWSTLAGRLLRPFNLAGFNDALQFGFDANPELCYALNNNRLPFGCHGWYGKYGKFWQNIIPR